MSITHHLNTFRDVLEKQGAQLVAVSKTKPSALVMEAYEAGQRAFGENKVQELMTKHAELPQAIEWHMIGHLQSNKVKYIAPFVALIHGVDSLKLLKEIDKQGRKNRRIIPCLLQIHIADEASKFGFSPQEIKDLLNSGALDGRRHVMVKGLMGMATHTPDTAQIRSEFKQLKALYDFIKSNYTHERLDFQTLSMGMSNDYEIALAEGSNLIRIGSAIFGTRD